MKILLAASLLLVAHAANASSDGQDLPAHFEANRVYVVPMLANGQSLRFYTDSGGGANLLCRKAATREGIATRPMPAGRQKESDLGKNVSMAHLPAFAPGKSIPANADGNDSLIVFDCPDKAGLAASDIGDGFLSSRWFAGRTWTWDYPDGRLRLEGSKFTPDPRAHAIGLGLVARKPGEQGLAFVRIAIIVDGKPLQMLYDTGATTMLTPAAMDAVNDGLPAVRATSFVTHSTLQAWHTAHPDWRVIDKAEAGMDARMIEVPKVDIAGYRTGPVWFTERPDKNFREWMSSMMDKPVEGAVGGDLFRHFVITVDYPKAKAYFFCANGCADAR
ncbi:MAG TPA: hypothetical protein VGO76_15490 [Luteibacter sp.]|jgi:hypothetical protein|nr:hypothetical protein [Luteibacter sp.]